MVEESLDYDRLEGLLRALAYARRLEILHQLRQPRALSEIRVRPQQTRGGLNPERPMARQVVEEHLAQLMEIGVVTAQETPGQRARTYVLNGERLFQAMEELRRIGLVVEGAPPVPGRTVLATDRPHGGRPAGPHLVVTHGLREGRVYPLAAGLSWRIGRAAGVPIRLEYDPYASSQNSEIVARDGAFLLSDIDGSRNGTWLNWRRLDHGEAAALRAGDVVGVGRSLLVFRSD